MGLRLKINHLPIFLSSLPFLVHHLHTNEALPRKDIPDQLGQGPDGHKK